MPSDVLISAEHVSKKFCRSLKRSLWYGVQDMVAEVLPFGRRARSAEQAAGSNEQGTLPAPRSQLPSAGSSLPAPGSPLAAPGSPLQAPSSALPAPSSELQAPCSVLPAPCPPLRRDEFWAVNNVSFELRRGECLGLIGRNGAGKTTLLKMLNGLIKPDAGRIEMHGRVGALIALGAGFNPILTGRENIYVNGSVLGLTKREIDAKVDEIIEFAEIREFIDAPVQSYSSGMQVRLGFAVASSLNPDILILDEVLAVGDQSFRYKCYRRVDDIRSQAGVIFVSHDMPSTSRICNRVLVMARGRCEHLGDAIAGISLYVQITERQQPQEDGTLELYNPIEALDISGIPAELHYRAPLTLVLTVRCREDGGPALFRLNVLNMSGSYVGSCVIEPDSQAGNLLRGTNRWECKLACLPLKPGRYHISVGVSGPDGRLLGISNKRHQLAVTGGQPAAASECQLLLDSFERL